MLRNFRRSSVASHGRGVLAALVLIGSALLSASAAGALEVSEIESPGGIKAWLVEEHSVPLVALKFAFMGGGAQDPDRKEGLVAMVADLLTEGAGDLTERAFKDKLSELGTKFTASGGRDAMYLGMEALSKRFDASARLLQMAIVNPRFDADAVERVRAQRLADIARSANEPAKLALDRFYAEAFAGHPYAKVTDGTAESVASITPADLKSKHAELFAKDALRIVIVGDIDRQTAIAALDSIFGNLPDKAKAVAVPKVEPRTLPAPVVVAKDFPLATAAFGLPSLRSDHPDFAALQVLNHILGSGDFDSRLMEEIRVKRGLAYSIRTSLFRDSVITLMVGSVATKNEAMGTTLSVMKDVFADMARNGPTAAHFDNAKRYLTGSYLLDFDTNAKVANSLLGIMLDGKGPDYLLKRNERINAVTLADVKRVAAEVLKPERLVVTVVGKPKLLP
jgi:zinc protease